MVTIITVVGPCVTGFRPAWSACSSWLTGNWRWPARAASACAAVGGLLVIWRIFYLARMLTASEAAIPAAFHTASACGTQNSLASTADASVQFGHPFIWRKSFYISSFLYSLCHLQTDCFEQYHHLPTKIGQAQ